MARQRDALDSDAAHAEGGHLVRGRVRGRVRASRRSHLGMRGAAASTASGGSL